MGGIDDDEGSPEVSGESMYTRRMVGVTKGRRCGGTTRGFNGTRTAATSDSGANTKADGRTNIEWCPTQRTWVDVADWFDTLDGLYNALGTKDVAFEKRLVTEYRTIA